MAGMGVEEKIKIIAEVVTKGVEKLENLKKSILKSGNLNKNMQKEMNKQQTSLNNVMKKAHVYGSRIAKQQLNANKLMGDGAQKLLNNATNITNLGKKYDSFGKTMSMPFNKWQQFNKEGGEFTSRGAKMANTMRRATHGLRGFRMEMLSIMFFGMNLQKFFTGLLKPVMELTGLTELWTTTLQMVFLPIGMMLLDFLMPLMMWLMNLSDKTKLWIGWIVIGGVVLGVFLLVVGVLALALGGIILVFGGVLGIIDKLIPDVSVLGVNISSAIEAMLGITVVKTLFSGLKVVVGGLIGMFLELPFVSALLDDLGVKIGENETIWESLKRGVGKVWDTIKEELGLDGEFSAIEQGIEDIELAASGWLSEMRTMMEELGINDLVESFTELSQIVIDMAPDLEIIAEILGTIAGWVESIINSFKKLYGVGYEAGEKVGASVRGGTFMAGIRDIPNKILHPSLPTAKREMPSIPEINHGWLTGEPYPIPEINHGWLTGEPYPESEPSNSWKNANITVSPNYNISVSDKAEMERAMDDNNKRLVDDVKRMIGA